MQEDFENFYAATMETNGNCFLVASDVEVYREQCHMASRRGNCLEMPAPDATSALLLKPEQVYAPGQLIRLKQYDQMRLKSGHGGSFFADLEQAAGCGASTPGPLIPCLLTHGTIHSWAANRQVLPKELFLAHGFNRYPDSTQCPVPCLLEKYLSQISGGQAKELVGNGWHLPTMASFFLYVLAHCVSLEAVNRMTCHAERNLLVKGGSGELELAFVREDEKEEAMMLPEKVGNSRKRARLCA